MIELERELSFLVNKLPADLGKFPSKIIEDNYIPRSSEHPVIRIRRDGEKLEITKKYPANSKDGESGDSSRQVEHTIPLSREEYDALNSIDGKKFKKRRFAYEINGVKADLDVYLDKLSGLVVADFEFDSESAMENFVIPDFVGADVSQEKLIAGGMLAGKTYADIAGVFKSEYDYSPVAGTEKYEKTT